jgi:hypothetical protein
MERNRRRQDNEVDRPIGVEYSRPSIPLYASGDVNRKQDPGIGQQGEGQPLQEDLQAA